ncbi:MAG: sel1 repeat family protein [Clostridia bacterium]|nr:sel1 repeat family protein [Clostridia bacterium]
MIDMDKYERAVLADVALYGISKGDDTVEAAIRIITVSEKRAPEILPARVATYCKRNFGTHGGEPSRSEERRDLENHETYTEEVYDLGAAIEHIIEAAELGSLYAALFLLFYKKVRRQQISYVSGCNSAVAEYYVNDSALLEKCFNVLSKSPQNDEFIPYAIARAYAEGRGVARSLHSARGYYEASARLGEDMASVRLAAMAIENSASEAELKNAYEELTRVKETRPEHSTVAYYIGLCHYYGIGTVQDYDSAFRAFSVGSVFGGDSDVHSHDDTYRRQHYMKGVCHLRGLGTFKNLNAARAEFLGSLSERGMPEIKYAYGTALLMYNHYAWKSVFGAIESAAEEGYLPAVRKLADFYRIGYGTEKDEERADALLSAYRERAALGEKTESPLGKEADDYIPGIQQ